MKRKKLLGAFLIVALLSLTVGVSIAFFNYTRTGSENVLAVGRIEFVTNQTNTITLQNVFPIDSDDVDTDTTNVGTFTVTIQGDTDYSEGIEYLVSSVDSNLETTGGKKIPVSLDFTVTNLGTSNDNYFTARESKNVTIYKLLNEEIDGDKKILVGYIKPNTTLGTAEGVNGSISIKAYLDKDKIAISDTYDGNESDNMGTTNDWVNERTVLTTTEWNALQINGISFKVRIEANEGIWVEDTSALAKVQKAITEKINAETNPCNPIWVDNMDTQDESDDITYFSGTNECVDMNYVWYSGKLWRITAIYPDGTMKMVTEDALTTINWGSTIEYNGSYVYQWVNEDFYDTLVNPNNILISNATWNYSEDSNSTPVKPETIATQKVVSAPVGMLNAYEYYNAYRNANASTNYLNIGFSWWLITPYSTSYVRYVNHGNGVLEYFYGTSGWGRSVRPSIYLKSGVEFTGRGTKSNPYNVVGDKENPVNGTLINRRSSGEYVKFDNDIYRIVSIDDTLGITKLIKIDFVRDNGTLLTKNFASSNIFGKNTNTQDDTYWDYYLNNTWYESISTTYKNMLVDSTYYLGLRTSGSFKETLCKDVELDNVTTKNCTKYTGSDTDKTFTGKVGLPRIGEMFASQLRSGDSSFVDEIWLITPLASSRVSYIFNEGYLSGNYTSGVYSTRPTITLDSNVIITGGTGYVGGSTNDPFEIALSNNG